MPGEAIGQDRDEGTAFAAGQHRFDDAAPVGAQHAAVVVHGDPGGALHRQVHQARRPAPPGRVLALGADAADHVVALRGALHQARDFLRRVLQVGIEGDHQVSTGLFEAGEDRRVLAVVAVEDHRHHGAAVAFGGGLQEFRGAVAAAVVDQHDLEGAAQLQAGGLGAAQQFGQAGFLVVDRDHHRDQVDRIGLHRRFSRMSSMARATRSMSSSRMSGNSGMEHRRAEFHSLLGRLRRGWRWR